MSSSSDLDSSSSAEAPERGATAERDGAAVAGLVLRGERVTPLPEGSPALPPRRLSSGSASIVRWADVGDDPVTAALMRGAHPSSMFASTGRFFTWLLSLLLRGVVFSSRSVAAIKDAESRGAVVYVMQTRSIIDYLYFGIAFAQHGLRPARFANGVNTWVVRPFWQAIRTRLRGRRGLPRDAECLERILRAGGSGFLFLQRRSRGEADRARFSRVYLERLIAVREELPGPVFLVPLLLVWDKHPDRDQPSLLDNVFGTRQDPGFFRKLLHVAKQTWESFLNLGAPQVQVSEPVALLEVDGTAEESAAAVLERQLSERLEQERRVIVGPGVKSAKQIRQEILTDRRTVAMIREVSEQTGQDIAAVQHEAGEALKSIAADFSMFVIKVLSALLGAVFNQIYDGLEVDEDGLDELRRVAREKHIVLVPSHKSHIDYLLLSYLFYQRGLIPPHIAAGDNLSFWPMGSIFRRAGAFFLRRSFAGDPLYPRVFDAYLVKLLEEGFFIEFFIEGTRSRTGKLNPPKYGMLTMLLDAHRVGGIEPMAFVPVSVGYENVIEGASYQEELQGAEKKAESLGGLLRTTQVLRSKYGRVYVEFGQAIDAAEFVREHHPDGGRKLPKAELDRTVRRLAYRIIHEINDVTTVTPSALAALIVLNNPARGMDRETLAREAGFVLSFLSERKARLSGSLQTAINARFATIRGLRVGSVDLSTMDEYDRDYVRPVEAGARPSAGSIVRITDRAMGEAVLPTLEEALRLLADKGLIEIREVDDDVLIVAAEARRTELAYYKNNIVHYFIDEAVFATALYLVEGTEVDDEPVRAYAKVLSKMLKHEFCFGDRQRFDQVFECAKSYFADRGWITVTDAGTIAVTDPPPAGAEFIRGLLIPTLESYFLIASALPEIAQDWVDDKALTKRLLTRGSAMHLKGELEHGEAIAKATLQNALRVFQEWDVLERRDKDRGRARKKAVEFRLSDEYRGPLIEELIAELSAMVERQKRRPGELLRRL